MAGETEQNVEQDNTPKAPPAGTRVLGMQPTDDLTPKELVEIMIFVKALPALIAADQEVYDSHKDAPFMRHFKVVKEYGSE